MAKERKKGAAKNNLKYFFKYQIKVPFIMLYNFFYFMKYPFWQPRNVWTGKKYWTFTEYNQISPGWRKAFGKQLSKDLRAALKKAGQLKTFYFLEIKEKYGQLCLYGSSTTDEVWNLLQYYERLSICYCEGCGKPARFYRYGGWTGYVCANCFTKEINEAKPEMSVAEKYKIRAKHRLKVKDIPTTTVFKDGKEVKLNDIDYRAAWGIKSRRANINVNERKEVQK